MAAFSGVEVSSVLEEAGVGGELSLPVSASGRIVEGCVRRWRGQFLTMCSVELQR